MITRDGKRVALRIEGDTVREVPVTEGLSDGRLVQIASGLQAGDVDRLGCAPGHRRRHEGEPDS